MKHNRKPMRRRRGKQPSAVKNGRVRSPRRKSRQSYPVGGKML